MKKNISTWKVLGLLTLVVMSVAAHRIWIEQTVGDLVVSVENNTPASLNPIMTNYSELEPLKPHEFEAVAAAREITKLDAATQEKLGLEPDLPEQSYFAFLVPDDPTYPQWYTTNINAPAGWDITTGDSSIIIAVIDTGYALEHEDLSTGWHINIGEQGTTAVDDACWTGIPEDKQTNNCDDDGNNYIDDWRGWDFANNDNNSEAGDNSLDGSTHGSKVSGLVAGRSDNGVGTASINWESKIMPLQGLHDEGYGFSSEIAGAVMYAADNGADVINMSLGSSSPDSIIYAAIRYATDKNVIVVASAGNCGAEQVSSQCSGYPSPGGMGYPARYAETIAVGATDSGDDRASFSSYGAELDLVAPGSGSIQTPTWSTSNATTAYSGSAYGTSFSSPIVAGMIGLIKAQFPELAKDEVLSILVSSTDIVSGMADEERTDEYGYGLLNVESALQEIDRLISQQEKAGGQVIATDAPPLITTAAGHTQGTRITWENTALTYCVTSPNTECQLELYDPVNDTTINLGTRSTNTQGIVSWEWSSYDAPHPATWEATVTANSLTSSAELLIAD